MALSDREVNVIDSSLSNDPILCKDGGGGDMILHWAAEDLLEKLVERDPLAMVEFLGSVRKALILGDAALKTASECSFTTRKLRFLGCFRLA
ncbi:hypothetical protein VA602_23495 [Pseudomonas sp. MH2]|uniref:Uncharacterized protein n=1 Tax=Pseudomonas machongensis TaxID=3110229 RepID=A0ABU5VLN7_9PSED|nr:hypothetical protein [Pseudomonas sp. MH2]MEA5674287.1 hypothetical protein [Pseudomonas sp. MH2]